MNHMRKQPIHRNKTGVGSELIVNITPHPSPPKLEPYQRWTQRTSRSFFMDFCSESYFFTMAVPDHNMVGRVYMTLRCTGPARSGVTACTRLRNLRSEDGRTTRSEDGVDQKVVGGSSSQSLHQKLTDCPWRGAWQQLHIG